MINKLTLSTIALITLAGYFNSTHAQMVLLKYPSEVVDIMGFNYDEIIDDLGNLSITYRSKQVKKNGESYDKAQIINFKKVDGDWVCYAYRIVIPQSEGKKYTKNLNFLLTTIKDNKWEETRIIDGINMTINYEASYTNNLFILAIYGTNPN